MDTKTRVAVEVAGAINTKAEDELYCEDWDLGWEFEDEVDTLLSDNPDGLVDWAEDIIRWADRHTRKGVLNYSTTVRRYYLMSMVRVTRKMLAEAEKGDFTL